MGTPTQGAPAKLCAAFSVERATPELASLVQRMTATLGLLPGQLHVDDRAAGGVIAAPAVKWVAAAGNAAPACCIAAAGLITAIHPLAGSQDAADAAATTRGDLVAQAGRLLWQHGAPALRGITGVFSLVAADTAQPHAVLANDRLGFAPLFYAIQGDLLLAASEVKAIAAVLDATFDPAAWGAYFYVGHLLRRQTLYREIRALGPGEMIEWQAGRTAVQRYYDPAQVLPADTEALPVRSVYDAWQQAVQRWHDDAVQETLLLSGGFDSRLILGALLSQGHHPQALTLEHAGFAGGLDGSLAKQVAAQAGLEQDFRPTRPHFYRSRAALEVFCLGDGMTPSFGLFISQVYPELDAGMGRVWDGLSLDLCLGGHSQLGSSLRSNLPALLASYTVNRRYLKHFLRREWYDQIERGFQAELEAELAQFPDTEDGWIRFQMVNRKRRRVGMPPHHLYTRKVLALTPACDSDFVEVMWRTPLSQRQHYHLYTQLLLQDYPDLATVEVLSGETRVSVDKLAGGEVHHGGGVSSRLRRWVKGLGLAPYLRSWQSRRSKVQRALHDALPPETVVETLRYTGFDRACYNRPAIEKALAQAEAGSLYWINGLAVVFTAELWHLLGDVTSLAELSNRAFIG